MGDCIFITIIIFFIWLSYKADFLIVFNYIAGFFIVLFLTNLHFEGNSRIKEEMLIFILNTFLYTFLFVSSAFIYFDKENGKRHFAIFPVFAYCFLILIEISLFKFPNPIFSIFCPVALAFFPLYILKYYIKYIKEENI